jgi:hypothetical protein
MFPFFLCRILIAETLQRTCSTPKHLTVSCSEICLTLISTVVLVLVLLAAAVVEIAVLIVVMVVVVVVMAVVRTSLLL